MQGWILQLLFELKFMPPGMELLFVRMPMLLATEITFGLTMVMDTLRFTGT